MKKTKAVAFWPVLISLVAVDCATKQLAVDKLTPAHLPHRVVGDILRLTLAYNPDAAMGLSAGGHSRIAFSVIAAVMLCGLGLYRRRIAGDGRTAAIALALIGGGAAGNLIDRLRSSRGVVDFIDIGFGAARFWTFNVADAGVFCGALLLVLALSRSEHVVRDAVPPS